MPSLIRAEKRRKFEHLRNKLVVIYVRVVQCFVLILVSMLFLLDN